jgi:SCY1-like protein 2
MFAAATSFFSRSNISQNYNIGTISNGSRTATPTPVGSPSLSPAALVPPFHVGLWRVQSAAHKVTHKRVSVWSFEKRGPETSGPAKEIVLEVLKTEV